jgi:hypothetical protein
MSGPPWLADQTDFPPSKTWQVVVRVERLRWRSLCALRTSSRINGPLTQREWTMYCTKDAGRREHWFLLRTDLSNPVLCIAVSRRKGLSP